MKSDYGKDTYTEEFDAHLDFTGMHPGTAPEFRSICSDADEEISALRARLADCKLSRSLAQSEREMFRIERDAANARVATLDEALTAALEDRDVFVEREKAANARAERLEVLAGCVRRLFKVDGKEGSECYDGLEAYDARRDARAALAEAEDA